MPHTPFHCAAFLAITMTASAFASRAAAAELPMLQEFAGAHAQGMAMAHRAVGAGSEVVLSNPASIALARRYQVELNYGFTGGQHLNDLAVGLVDSKSSPVAMGVMISRLFGDQEGLNPALYRAAIAAAYAVSERLAFGATFKRQWGELSMEDQRHSLRLWTGSVGVAVRLGEMFRLAASWENLFAVQPDRQALLAPALALGGAMVVGKLMLAADLRFDRRPQRRESPDLFLGAEVPVGTTLVARGGYRVDTRLNRQIHQAATFGLGALAERARLDLSLARELRPSTSWSVYTSLQLLM